MPAWTKKEERQYEHIKSSSKKRGKSEARAKEIAARTVNKSRRLAGKTPNQQTQGTGNPNKRLEERSRDELYNIAREMNIAGRSHLRKAELIEAIRSRR
jgi:plasmid stabilization system protein ParE